MKIMEIKDYENLWNAQADEYNQWDNLNCDEKCEWIIEQIKLSNGQDYENNS